MNDLSYVTSIVRELVTKYGFSVIGPISISSDNNDLLIGDGLIGKKSNFADNTFSKIDQEIISISKISLDNSIKILKKNRSLLDELVKLLLVSETIDNKIFKEISFDLLKI